MADTTKPTTSSTANDPTARAARQVAATTDAIDRSVEALAAEVTDAGLDRHGAIVNHLKGHYGVTHGNANAVAHAIRRQLAGGSPSEAELLGHQYRGDRAVLRPVLDAVLAAATTLGDDVDVVVQKTGVSLRRSRQFALVQVPSARRVALGLNLGRVGDLDAHASARRLTPTSGMCSHRVDLTAADVADGRLDDEVVALLALAAEHAS